MKQETSRSKEQDEIDKIQQQHSSTKRIQKQHEFTTFLQRTTQQNES